MAVDTETHNTGLRLEALHRLFKQTASDLLWIAHLEEAANVVSKRTQIARSVRRFLEPSIDERSHAGLDGLRGGNQDKGGDDESEIASLPGAGDEGLLKERDGATGDSCQKRRQCPIKDGAIDNRIDFQQPIAEDRDRD